MGLFLPGDSKGRVGYGPGVLLAFVDLPISIYTFIIISDDILLEMGLFNMNLI